MTAPFQSSLQRLEEVARACSTLANRMVFYGGATAPLLVDTAVGRTEDAARPITAISYSSRDRLRPELRQLGLEPDANTVATERWRTPSGVAVEIIANEADEAKYPNPWYAYSLDCTTTVQLSSQLSVKIAGAPAFLAAAWWNATKNSQRAEDFEDVVTLVHGRPAIASEIAVAPRDVRIFLAEYAKKFLELPEADVMILDALPRAVRLSGAVERVIERFQQFCVAV